MDLYIRSISQMSSQNDMIWEHYHLRLYDFGVLRFAVWADAIGAEVVYQILQDIHLLRTHIMETEREDNNDTLCFLQRPDL